VSGRLEVSAGGHSGLCAESCGDLVLGEATLLVEASVIMGAMVLKAMVLVEIYVIVGATVLVEIYAIVGAMVLKATVLVEIYVIVRATELTATVLVETFVIIGATVLGATVLAGASCSVVYTEVCVTLGHKVTPAPEIKRRAFRIVSNPYVSILRAVISTVIACGGFCPPSFAEGGFLCHHV
jgi:hypothetical protein